MYIIYAHMWMGNAWSVRNGSSVKTCKTKPQTSRATRNLRLLMYAFYFYLSRNMTAMYNNKPIRSHHPKYVAMRFNIIVGSDGVRYTLTLVQGNYLSIT